MLDYTYLITYLDLDKYFDTKLAPGAPYFDVNCDLGDCMLVCYYHTCMYISYQQPNLV